MNILIVEDNKQLSESIAAYLLHQGYQCDLTYDLEGAMEKITLHDYDCILLDITLPDGSGLKLMEQIKENGKADGVIIISAKDLLDDRIRGLEMGADDYLSKPFHLSELNARIGALIRRKIFQGSNKLSHKELTVDILAQLVKVHDHPVSLTRKEYDLLLFLLSNRSRVVSKSAIAVHLSGNMADMIDNYGFIYAHMKNLKKKLHESGCKDYIKTVYGFGYQWES
jgi:DNA-binding response OmpR family regulator